MFISSKLPLAELDERLHVLDFLENIRLQHCSVSLSTITDILVSSPFSLKIFSLLQHCGVSLSTVTDILVRKYSVCYNSVVFLFPLFHCWQRTESRVMVGLLPLLGG